MPSAAILNGGGATRLGGCDKGALVVGGRSIVVRQLHELAEVADDILMVGGRVEASVARPVGATMGGPIGAAGNHPRVRVIPDRVPGCGPLSGLDAALRAARHDTLIVIACDMPFVTAPLLRYLLSLAAGADAVVPLTEDGYHPLCAAYTRACQPVVTRRLAEGRLALTGLIGEMRTRVVTREELGAFGDPAALLTNVNTRAAFDAIEALLSHEA